MMEKSSAFKPKKTFSVPTLFNNKSIANDSSRQCLEQLKQFTIGTTLKEIPAKIGMDLEHPLPVSKAVQFEMTIRLGPQTSLHETDFLVGCFRRKNHEDPEKQFFQLHVLLFLGVCEKKWKDCIVPDDHFPVQTDQLRFLV